ncbi:aldolase [Devosia neptuniae]|jgi:ribulose-5-phosphate 4-epimerase/fuculose-1-phosphate aldolase|uniref:3-oxo-tetronate 4-phosphate decarboxylase n=1 Tax=Devosia TaxID=46913 RepID=UPI0022B04C8A|nr:aldolase [Devosia neptuniae]MCZ4347065.1 aldolase [Devosia neptuniae]|tara:strand:+ start:61456 stop:62091 length:636 start_codon:yes stop_codon:yes gene_type:complete
MSPAELRAQIVELSRSLFERGYSVGSSGNISVAVEGGGFLVTPTNSCLGRLDADAISLLDADWNHIGGDAPSKEVFLHRAFYESRPGTGAVVHLHSTYATALSCLSDTDPANCIPPITPYVVMRVGTVRMVDYAMPGDPVTGDLIRGLDGQAAAVLLANHGPVVAGANLTAAVYAAEELEETAKLVFLMRGLASRQLTAEQVAALNARFKR